MVKRCFQKYVFELAILVLDKELSSKQVHAVRFLANTFASVCCLKIIPEDRELDISNKVRNQKGANYVVSSANKSEIQSLGSKLDRLTIRQRILRGCLIRRLRWFLNSKTLKFEFAPLFELSVT